jgi:hypothetical protein
VKKKNNNKMLVDETKTKNKLKKRREKPSPREPYKSELIS